MTRFLQNFPERPVSVVTEESENIYGQRTKSGVYNDAKAEKDVRATLKSAVLRVLSKDGVVILDSLNYIKGKEWGGVKMASSFLTRSTTSRVRYKLGERGFQYTMSFDGG